MKRELTQKEYLNAQGQQCPFCRSRHISQVGDPQVDADYARADVKCEDCKSEWVDLYTLAAYAVKT